MRGRQCGAAGMRRPGAPKCRGRYFSAGAVAPMASALAAVFRLLGSACLASIALPSGADGARTWQHTGVGAGVLGKGRERQPSTSVPAAAPRPGTQPAPFVGRQVVAKAVKPLRLRLKVKRALQPNSVTFATGGGRRPLAPQSSTTRDGTSAPAAGAPHHRDWGVVGAGGARSQPARRDPTHEIEFLLRLDRASGLPVLRADASSGPGERSRTVRLSEPLVAESRPDGVALLGDMRLESFGFKAGITGASLSGSEARAAGAILRRQHHGLASHRFAEVQRLAGFVRTLTRPSQALESPLFVGTMLCVTPGSELEGWTRADVGPNFADTRPFSYRIFQEQGRLVWHMYLPSLRSGDESESRNECWVYRIVGKRSAKYPRSLFDSTGSLARYDQSWLVKGSKALRWHLRDAGAPGHGMELRVHSNSVAPLVLGQHVRPIGFHDGAIVLGGSMTMRTFIRRDDVGLGDAYVVAEAIWHQHLALLRLGLGAQKAAADLFGKWLANRRCELTQMDRDERADFESAGYWPLRRFSFKTEPFRYYIRLSEDKAVELYVALHPHFDDLKFSLEPVMSDARPDIEH